MVMYQHYDDSIRLLDGMKMHREKGSNKKMESEKRKGETGEDRENEV